MSAQERTSHLKTLSTSLHQVVDRTLLSRLAYTHEPQITEKDIIEYESRMRVSAMEKFNGPCFISVINFYNSSHDLEKHQNAKGAVVLYLEENNATKLLKTLGYPVKLDEDEDVVMQQAGQLTKNIVNEFKGDLNKAGYAELVFSPPQNFKNQVPQGVEFDYNEFLKYEMIYSLWKEKAVAVDFTLGK